MGTIKENVGSVARTPCRFVYCEGPLAASPPCDPVKALCVASGKVGHRSSIRRNICPTRWFPERLQDVERNCLSNHNCHEGRMGACIVSPPIQAWAKAPEAPKEVLQPAMASKGVVEPAEPSRAEPPPLVDLKGAVEPAEPPRAKPPPLVDVTEATGSKLAMSPKAEFCSSDGTRVSPATQGEEEAAVQEIERLRDQGKDANRPQLSRTLAGTPEAMARMRGDFNGASIWDQYQFSLKEGASKPMRPTSAPNSSSFKDPRCRPCCLSSGGVRPSSVVRSSRRRKIPHTDANDFGDSSSPLSRPKSTPP